jgi:hypothetical protein
MKNIILYLIFAAGLLSLTPSCINEVLDKQPLDIISEDVVWNDPNLVDAYIAREYSRMIIFNFDKADHGANGWTWDVEFGFLAVSVVADETGSLIWYGNDNWFRYKIGGLTINGGLLEWWENAYSIIRQLNMLIEKLPESSNDPAFIASRMAEARFLRAFNYFAMVKRYGGVPLITKTLQVNASEEELYPVRNSEKEIYDFIIDEIDAIEEDLQGMAYGRASQGAALALKCRAAMYAGSIAKYGGIQLNGLLGIPQDQAAGYFQKSVAAAQKIATLGYTLYKGNADKVKNFRELFLVKRNSEMIFVRQQDRIRNWLFYDFALCPKPHGYDAGMAAPIYLEMVEEFEYLNGASGKLDRNAIQQGLWSMEELLGGRDPRLYASIWTNGMPWKGDTIRSHRGLIGGDGILLENQQQAYGGISAWGNQNAGGNFGSGFGVLKMLDENGEANMDQLGNMDCPIFRYGEVLLNLAESAYEIGQTDVAQAALNQIRDRAGIERKSVIDLETIRHERKVELFFEGHRYWDLRRWRIAEDKLAKPGSGLRFILDYNTRKYKIEVINDYDGVNNRPRFEEHYYYLPITLGRTGQNPNLVENPGYR